MHNAVKLMKVRITLENKIKIKNQNYAEREEKVEFVSDKTNLISVVHINIKKTIPLQYPASFAAIAFSFQTLGLHLTILVALHFF